MLDKLQQDLVTERTRAVQIIAAMCSKLQVPLSRSGDRILTDQIQVA